MVWITYVTADGRESRVDVRRGDNLMLGAVLNNIAGIDGECGGCLSCATCHVYIDTQGLHRLPEPDPMELEMLEAVACERTPTSRLCCQVTATPELEGLRVEIPARQS